MEMNVESIYKLLLFFANDFFIAYFNCFIETEVLYS